MHISQPADATPSAVRSRGRPSGQRLPQRLRSARTPEEAFDALYACAAADLVHQTYLLTGNRRRAFESVEHAFRHAWDHWPETAVDPDPVGRVRAHAHEYALSPWHRLRRGPKPWAGTPPVDPVAAALLELPPLWRRTVLLCEGLGMSVAQAAAETAASTPAARNRLTRARALLARRLPGGLRDPEKLERRLGTLVANVSTATLPSARSVRTGGEERIRTLTRTVFGATAALAALIVFTAVTTPSHHAPSHQAPSHHAPSAPNRAATTAPPTAPPPPSTHRSEPPDPRSGPPGH